MVVHLLTNSSVLDSAATFQENVYTIHSLGKALWLVEWGFIFLPLLFHAIFGVVIIRSGTPNQGSYNYVSNWRYTLQRVTGMIAFIFIFVHVFHLHGWFHNDWWMETVAKPLGGAQFRPFNATSSLGLAMKGLVMPALYAIGVLASVFHLANGIWTMGITWGLLVSPESQRRANYVCIAGGLVLAVIGMSALTGAKMVDVDEAIEAEDKMYRAKIESGRLDEEVAEHKRFTEEEREAIEEATETATPELDAEQGESDSQADSDTEPSDTLPTAYK